MQCKLIRELEVSPGVMPPEFVAANAVARKVTRNRRPKIVLFWRVGTIFAQPDAFRLVQHGCALPADDECEQACGMSPDQMAAAQHAYERLEKGIHPDDFELFDHGIITGYDGNGDYLPGPNWKMLEDAATEAKAAEVVTTEGHA